MHKLHNMKVLFLSDLHLGANYIANSRAHESAVCKFLKEKDKDADHIYLLGDVLDYWYEYRNVVPHGYVRFFGTLASLSDNGVKITWLTGNHDIWLFDYLKNEIGIEIVDAPYINRHIGNKTFVLAHGDRIGESNLSFRLLCSLFRSKICQKLYSGIHPRWTVPFAHKWSSNSRYSHQLADDDEMQHSKTILEDVRNLLKAQPDADFVIIGHHHIIMDEMITGTKSRLIVLGDWIDKFSYAEFDGESLTLHKYDTGKITFGK